VSPLGKSGTDGNRYCKEVGIDPYYTLKRRKEGRFRNFFRWYCDSFSVKKVSSMETYWHNLSQLYTKVKDGKKMNVLTLRRIYEVSSHLWADSTEFSL
jgi:integrase